MFLSLLWRANLHVRRQNWIGGRKDRPQENCSCQREPSQYDTE